jgi:hypothetical protein
MEMENKKEEKKMGFWDILKKILDVGNKNDDDDDDFCYFSYCDDPFYPYSSFSSYFNRFGGDD